MKQQHLRRDLTQAPAKLPVHLFRNTLGERVRTAHYRDVLARNITTFVRRSEEPSAMSMQNKGVLSRKKLAHATAQQTRTSACNAMSRAPNSAYAQDWRDSAAGAAPGGRFCRAMGRGEGADSSSPFPWQERKIIRKAQAQRGGQRSRRRRMDFPFGRASKISSHDGAPLLPPFTVMAISLSRSLRSVPILGSRLTWNRSSGNMVKAHDRECL